MIRAVLFDVGGVLVNAGRAGRVQRVATKLYGLSEARPRLAWPYVALLRIVLRTDKLFARLRRRLGHMPSPGAYKKVEAVYELATALRQHGIRTGILSNVFNGKAARLQSASFYDGFDPLILSSEKGTAKPDRALYELAGHELKVSSPEILFIDDQPANLFPAKALGMHTILAKTPDQIVADTCTFLKRENNLRTSRIIKVCKPKLKPNF